MAMRRRRARQRPPGWAVAIGGALAAAGGLAVAWRKTRIRTLLPEGVPGSASGQSPAKVGWAPSAGAPGRGPGEDASSRQPWQCGCGQAYLVAGQDRHQIYWLEGADESDPVLSDHCPNCDRPLPAVSRANAAD